MGLGSLGEGEEPLGMPAPQRIGLALLVETLERVAANRLEHPEAFTRMTDEAFLDERFEHVELRGRHLLSCVEPAAAGEDGEPREEPLLGLVPEPQQRAAGDEDVEVRALREDVSDRRAAVDDLLEVVEDEQQFSLTDVAGEVVAGAEGAADLLEHELRIVEWRELDPEDT